MNVAQAVAQVLKREGVEFLFAYPVNPLIETAAELDIRTVIVRQERIGLHMADAISRMSSGRKIGVFCMQSGPGTENAYGGVAQAFGESVPIVVLPMGYRRIVAQLSPNFHAYLNFQHITKSCEYLVLPETVPEVMRRAFTQVRNGRPGPALVEFPTDILDEEVPEPLDYRPTPSVRVGPDPDALREAAEVLVAAQRPVIYAGQGVHYAEAWPELKQLAELLEAPVTTSLDGKSAFPENHPLSLGCGGRSMPEPVHVFMQQADVIFGIGCSFTRTSFGLTMPEGKTYIHATLDPGDINKDVESHYPILGDAALTLRALIDEVSDRLKNRPRGRRDGVVEEIRTIRQRWMKAWMPKLRDSSTPFSPYRVISDMIETVDIGRTVITHDATTPLSYIGWGKTTQLGYGLGLAMGAKLAHPDRLCINVWGDAAIGFTGMDFETAVRERIPILSVLFNNHSMAIEIPVMPTSQAKYGATDISGNYAMMAEAFGGYGERVESPDEIIPALKRGIRKTEEGVPVLLEFMTSKEIDFSFF